MTLRQTLFALLSEKRSGLMRDSPFENLLWLLHHHLLPSGNNLPTSLYMAREVIKCPDLQDYERQACPKSCMRWPYTPRKDWIKHQDDVCATCGSARFKSKLLASGCKRLTPAAAYWDFGIHHVLQQLNSDQEYISLKGSAVIDKQDNGFFANDEAQRLDDLCGGKFFDHKSNTYLEIGGDFGQMFDKATHSTCLILVRDASLRYEDKGMMRFIKPLIVIAGPKEPESLKCFFIDTLEFLASHSYMGSPVTLNEYQGNDDNVSVPQTLWLLGAFGDSPFRQKLSCWLGHSAYLGCGWCIFEGWHSGGMYFKGYSEPYKFKRSLTTTSHHAWDPKIKLTHMGHIDRAKLVESFISSRRNCDYGLVGCKGLSVFPKYLPYVDYNNFFTVPICHALLYGVLKNFISILYEKDGTGNSRKWYVINHAQRRIIAQRENRLTATSEYTSPPSHLNKYKTWTMHEFLHFALTWSCYVFGNGDVMHVDVFKMWIKLRQVIALGYSSTIYQHLLAFKIPL